MMTEPIIGLTTYGRLEKPMPSQHYEEHFALPAQYVHAVRRAGGVPILLPPGQDDWQPIVDIVDGIILTGGGDIHPDRYQGNGGHPDIGGVDDERDASELALVRTLVSRTTLPTLCICRGMQVANVALGGTLTEHIPDIRPDDIHRAPVTKGWTLQAVSATPGSKVADAMQAVDVATFSGHHQAVNRLGSGLRVTAVAPDGLVESVELDGHPWFVAVQWHPEVSASDDPTQQSLFDAFVGRARLFRSERFAGTVRGQRANVVDVSG